MQLGQEWRTENSNRHFPFAEDSTIPKDFITDIKLVHGRRGTEEVHLQNVSISDDKYYLEFAFSDGEIAISTGTDLVPRLHGLKQVSIFGENNESVVFFSTGDSWENPPDNLGERSGKLDESVVSSGPNLIRRLVIYGENNDESSWRKEVVQSIVGGTSVEIALKDNQILIPGQRSENFIEISAIYGGGDGPPPYTSEDGILTINGISPSKGNINISGLDCINTADKPEEEDNRVQVRSNCLPCCGCSSYQLISDAITYRSKRLAELCCVLNKILNSSAEKYNAAIMALADSQMPVARIRAVRVYNDRIKMALQNVCALPIYGTYGVTINLYNVDGTKTEFRNVTTSSVIQESLPAPAKYNSYINSESVDIPEGEFRGTVGPIGPGSYVDLEFVTGAPDGEQGGTTEKDQIISFYNTTKVTCLPASEITHGSCIRYMSYMTPDIYDLPGWSSSTQIDYGGDTGMGGLLVGYLYFHIAGNGAITPRDRYSHYLRTDIQQKSLFYGHGPVNCIILNDVVMLEPDDSAEIVAKKIETWQSGAIGGIAPYTYTIGDKNGSGVRNWWTGQTQEGTILNDITSGAALTYNARDEFPEGARSVYSRELNREFRTGGYQIMDDPDLPTGFLFCRSDENRYSIPSYAYSMTKVSSLCGASEYYDIKNSTFSINTQANGYFGTLPTLGCKKDEYNVFVIPDHSSAGCNSSGANTRYKVVLNDAPEAP